MLLPSRIQLFSFPLWREIAEKMRVESDQKENVDADLFLPSCRKIELLMRAHMNIRSIFENEEACQKRVEPRLFGRDRHSFLPFFSFAFPLVRGGGGFLSSSWTITIWLSPAFSIVNLLHESGRSHNSRPIDSDGYPVSLKEKLDRMVIGLPTKLGEMAEAENLQNQRKKQRAPRIFLFIHF